VRFSLPDGRRVETEVALGSRPRILREGQRVTVLYDPDQPRRAGIEGAVGMGSVVTGFLVLFGAFFVLVGVAVAALMIALTLNRA
jgi:hypothetical protein